MTALFKTILSFITPKGLVTVAIAVGFIGIVYQTGRRSAGTPMEDRLEQLEQDYHRLEVIADSLDALQREQMIIILQLTTDINATGSAIDQVVHTDIDRDSLRSAVMDWLHANSQNP